MLPHSSFLQQAVVIFGAAVAVAWLFRMLRAPAIIGFLFTGMLIGPASLKLINRESVDQFAEVGLILLLFNVGLELSPEPLLRTGHRMIVAAILQIALTVLAGVICMMTVSSVSWTAALAVALVITPSSTAIALKVLGDMRQSESAMGSTVTGVSLVQDIVVIGLMLFLPLMANVGQAGLISSIGWALVSLLLLVLAALALRAILPRIMHTVLRVGGQELLTLFAVLMACAGAWLAGRAGWSPALGACIAGMLLAETDTRHQLFADIVPFRDVFNALFFISLGMLVDVSVALSHPLWVIGGVLGVLFAKSALAAAAVLLSGWPLRLGVQVGIGLATVSEFGYVLAMESHELQLFDAPTMDVLTAVIVGTMILGAMMVPLADRLSRFAERLLARRQSRRREPPGPSSAPEDVQVVIVGYGLNGKNLGRVLRETGMPSCVVEMNPTLAAEARGADERVLVGDATRWVILQRAGLAHARALVIAINDPDATRRIVAQAHAARPDLFILARTRTIAEVDVLHRLGAREVIPEEFETSIEIFTHVLHEFRVPTNVIEAQIALIRSGRYGMLRGVPGSSDQRKELLQYLDATATQTFLLPAESPVCGRTIRDTELRARTGTTIIAVVRNGKPTTNPTPDLRLEAGDVLVLVGAHGQLDNAKSLLTPPSGQSPATPALPQQAG